VSSIADKFKKLLPANSGNDKARVDGSGSTLSLDDVDTVQVPDEKTVRLARKQGHTPDAPAPTGFADGATLIGEAANEADAASAEAQAQAPTGRAGSNPARQQRILAILLAVVVLLLLLVAGSAILRAERLAQQVAATGQSMMQSQRLAKSISQALVGSAPAFVEVKDSADDLSRRVQGLTNGDDALRLERVGKQYDEDMAKINPLVARADTSAKAVLAQRQILTQVGAALRDINQQ
jgi:twitching motility protein PilJ